MDDDDDELDELDLFFMFEVLFIGLDRLLDLVDLDRSVLVTLETTDLEIDGLFKLRLLLRLLGENRFLERLRLREVLL